MSEKKPFIFEVCCGSAEDAIEAYKGGCQRVELNSNLFHGGLTPTVGSLITAKRHIDIPIMCMVRPREGGVFYGIKQMKMRPTDEGVFAVYPTTSSHPDPVEAEHANVYYALKNGPGIEPPKVGDLINVYLRPYSY